MWWDALRGGLVRRRDVFERREAIAQMQTRQADLAMVDLRMPDVGGLDVLRAIRETDPHCQVILMTGYASVDSAVEAIKLGALDYLSKPLDFDRLEQCSTASATSSSGAAACCRSKATSRGGSSSAG